MARAEKVKYLIIGNSAGGIGAAEAIRQVDKAASIAMISDEPYPAYSRPLISEYLAGKRTLEKILYRPPDFYEANGIQAILGNSVKKLDAEGRTVQLADGRKIAWQKLLLATGGLPIVPRIEGGDLAGIFTFTRLDDAKAIDQFLRQSSKGAAMAVVIGGGLIGVSVTEALVKRGVNVTVVEMKDRILNTILDEEASAMAQEMLAKAGVEIITGRTVTRATTSDGKTVTSAILDNNRNLPCDIIIVAIGVRPRTDIVAGTGITANRGIVVNRQMATSCPDVYACGDVTEAYDFVYGENRLTPIWPNAYLGGRTAGFNMAGVPAEYEGGTSMNALKYFGLPIVSAGFVMPPDNSYEVISVRRDHIYRKVVLKDGLVKGMLFANDIERSGIIFSLMKDRVKVDGFKQALVADDFGLVSLPETIWRPKLEMPAAPPADKVLVQS